MTNDIGTDWPPRSEDGLHGATYEWDGSTTAVHCICGFHRITESHEAAEREYMNHVGRDDIDTLVDWQMSDSPAALKQYPRKLHGPASALPGLALPAGMCPHVALDSTQVVEDRSEQ